MNEIVVKLQFLIPSLPRAEKAIAQYMLDNINDIHDMTLSMLAEETGSSEATIIRFCKRMGYRSFVQLKQDFARATYTGDHDLPDVIESHNSMQEIFGKVVDLVHHSLDDTKTMFANTDSEEILRLILHAKTLYFFAIGDAYSTCQMACMKFNRIGIPSFCCNDVVFQYETAMRLGKGDVVIAMSSSGRSQNIVRALRLAKEAGASTIIITQTARSPVIRWADHVLITVGKDITIGRDSINKRITELALIEAFYLACIAKGNLNYENLLQNTITSSDMNKQ